MKKRMIGGFLLVGLLGVLVGCNSGNHETETQSENAIISKALEEGKLSVEKNELAAAEKNFNLILVEDSTHQEAQDWLVLIEKYDELNQKIEENELEEADALYVSLKNHQYSSSMKENLTKIEERLKPSKGIYTNEELGFTFDYPKEWIDWIEIQEVKGELAEAEVRFTYINPTKELEQYVFSLAVYNEILDDDAWEMQKYITDDGVKTYALIISGEPDTQILAPENEEDLEFVQGMLAEIDMIERTFTLEETGESLLDRSYTKYTNIRYDFSVECPSGLMESQPLGNGDGIHVYNDDFDMTASGGNIGEAIEDYYASDLEAVEEVIEKQLAEDWYIVSYEEDGQVVYIKCYFDDRQYNRLMITYAASEKDEYEPMTDHIAKSFYALGQ